MDILSDKLQPSAANFEEEIAHLAKTFQNNEPYTHCVFDPLCQPAFLAKVHNELTHEMKANFKETDLFKLFQTAELGSLSEESLKDTMPSFLQLRNVIYSQEFRTMIERITGCEKLIDRVDCSANAYANSCHLLCHDDVIGTRCISYIIYLSDPDEEWQAHEGGALELYPLDESSIIDPTNKANLQGVPVATPSRVILPTFNTMLFFTVQPGRSYHSVQEVFCKHRPRLSISGWYHADRAPVGSDMSSLQQILSKGDKEDVYLPIPYEVTPVAPIAEIKGTVYGLTKEDIRALSQWVSSDYLTKKAIDKIRDQFIDDSSVQLHDFLAPMVVDDILQQIIVADHDTKLGKGRPSLDYSLGITPQWQLLGPPHKQRYLHYVPTDAAAADDSIACNKAGSLMKEVGDFLKSPLFAKYLSAITTVIALSVRQEVRRFRPGFDYTVAHYSLLTKEKHLDATLCFVSDDYEVEQKIIAELSDQSTKKNKKVNLKKRKAEKQEPKAKGKKGSKKSGATEEEEEEEEEEIAVMAGSDENDYGIQWEDGDVGGFECFIEADDDAETAEAAEVYRQENDDAEENDNVNKSGYDNKKEETTLLSVSAGNNSLSLVLRDEGIMKFVKYVSANAPGSRWDVATEYKILATDDDEEEDEEEEVEDGGENDSNEEEEEEEE